jgi:hypothetical protein
MRSRQRCGRTEGQRLTRSGIGSRRRRKVGAEHELAVEAASLETAMGLGDLVEGDPALDQA